MKKSELQNGIKKLKRVINRKNTLPILDNILNDNGKMTVSTLEVEYTVNIGFPGRFLMNLKQLDKIVTKLPAGSDIEISKNGEKVIVKIGNGASFKFRADDTGNFPMSVKCTEKVGAINEDDVLLIKKAVKFISDDKLRPVMTAVIVGKHVAASDAHRLVFYAHENGLNKDVLIQGKVVSSMNENNYAVFSNGTHIKLVNENEQIIYRHIDGKYPNYQGVIPTKSNMRFVLDTKELQDTVKLALITANEASELIKFEFSDSELKVSSADIDYDTSFERVIPCKSRGKDKEIDIGMKGTFLLSLLSDCEKSVTLKMVDSARAILINSDKLLMPMMLD